jgi:hypothetical protein
MRRPDLQLDRLDTIAAGLTYGLDERRPFGPLSTGEKLYVALAANRADLLAAMDYTMAQAVARVGDDWMRELVQRWQYGGPGS